MANFVIATEGPLTGDQERALTAALGNAGWWHWLPNFWVIIDPSETLTAVGLRDTIFEVTNRAKAALVLEVTVDKWGSLTRVDPDGKDNAANWLLENFGGNLG